MTWGAAQHHFGSKEEILDAVMALSHEKFTELMEDKGLRRGSVADRVDQFIDRMWQHYQDDLYLAALEILMETRGLSDRPLEPSIFEARSRGHLKTLREIFPESKLSDDQMIDALVFVHCFLTGLTIERLFENQIRHVDVHVRRIKVSLLSLLSFA